MDLLYNFTLHTNDFINDSIWFLSFVIISSTLAYSFKEKILYMFSFVMIIIFIFKGFAHLIDLKNHSNLKVYLNNDLIVFQTLRNNKVIKEKKIDFKNMKDFKYESKKNKDSGGLYSISGSTSHYKSITYFDKNKSKRKKLITTNNIFDSKYVTSKDLEIFIKILENKSN